MKLVIVESPAKAKTISRFLGKDYEVMASYGHVRDLPGSADEVPDEIKSRPWSNLAVDVDNDFKPYYVVPKESRKRIADLRKKSRAAEELILATDEDREGESISWHLLETIGPKVPVKRIVFHEITKSAIQEALAHPRDVDPNLVRAQETRRILDRLFGYSLSPVLWKKVGPKLSAGRVQSVAVRLVVEREEERKAFKVSEYWDVEAALEGRGVEFTASLVSLDGRRIASGKDFDPATGGLKTEDAVWLKEAEAAELANALAAAVPWRAARVEQKETRLRPDAPFITSTLQRAASSILGYSPKRTMQIAQRLYEGVDLGGSDREGLITYMRTDSVALSQEALRDAAAVIKRLFGEAYHQERTYSTRSKLAQEAHEAIRPTKLSRRPEDVAEYLSDEDLKLYRLIWNRTMASQMADAQLLRTTVDFEAKPGDRTAVLRATGSVVTFPGFLKVADSGQKDLLLPEIREGDEAGGRGPIAIRAIEPSRHETKPPARYTEASLIQRLEEEGIGRPSTYAPTISTIEQRGYVQIVGKTLVPTYLAIATNQLLKDHFGEYVDLGFTARMEDALDDIANGQEDSVRFLRDFYRGHGKFGQGLEHRIDEELPKIEFPAIPIGEDPETGAPLVVRLGRNAPYIQRGEGGADNTASIPPDLFWEDLTVEKALELLRNKGKANGPLGKDPKTGLPVYALTGPYGPYVQLGERSKANPKPKRASLPKGAKLENVDLPQALKLLSLPRDLGEHDGAMVTAGLGRFGPYVKRGDEFRSLEEGDDVYTITLERALELLSRPKQARRTTKKVLRELGDDPESGKPVRLCEGRYGPYVTNGKVNATIPKGRDPNAVTLEEALMMLAEAPAKKARRKAAAKRKTSK